MFVDKTTFRRIAAVVIAMALVGSACGSDTPLQGDVAVGEPNDVFCGALFDLAAQSGLMFEAPERARDLFETAIRHTPSDAPAAFTTTMELSQEMVELLVLEATGVEFDEATWARVDELDRLDGLIDQDEMNLVFNDYAARTCPTRTEVNGPLNFGGEPSNATSTTSTTDSAGSSTTTTTSSTSTSSDSTSASSAVSASSDTGQVPPTPKVIDAFCSTYDQVLRSVEEPLSEQVQQLDDAMLSTAPVELKALVALLAGLLEQTASVQEDTGDSDLLEELAFIGALASQVDGVVADDFAAQTCPGFDPEGGLVWAQSDDLFEVMVGGVPLRALSEPASTADGSPLPTQDEASRFCSAIFADAVLAVPALTQALHTSTGIRDLDLASYSALARALRVAEIPAGAPDEVVAMFEHLAEWGDTVVRLAVFDDDPEVSSVESGALDDLEFVEATLLTINRRIVSRYVAFVCAENYEALGFITDQEQVFPEGSMFQPNVRWGDS